MPTDRDQVAREIATAKVPRVDMVHVEIGSRFAPDAVIVVPLQYELAQLWAAAIKIGHVK